MSRWIDEIQIKVVLDETGSVRIQSSQLGVVEGQHTGTVKVPEEYSLTILKFCQGAWMYFDHLEILFQPLQKAMALATLYNLRLTLEPGERDLP